MNKKTRLMPDQETDISENPPGVNELCRFIRVFLSRWLVIFGLVVIIIVLIAAIFAPWLTPYQPNKQNLRSVLLSPSWEHPLGTDSLGRDTLTRVIFGTRTMLLVGVVSVSLSAFVGMILGLFAGYFGKWIQRIIMRLMDSLLAFPMILMAMVIASMLGGGIINVMVALVTALMPTYARLMYGQVLSAKEADYILAERSMGARNLRILFKHILPNCFPPLIVLITMMMGLTILAEASLSFLGIGIEPPIPAWGAMVSDGYEYVRTNPILSFAPGLAVMVVVFAFNMVGDGLRDALDPRLRGTI